MIEGILLPDLDDESAPFWEGCVEGELRIQQCARCGRFRFPPRPMCPWCRSFDRSWSAVSGRGRVWSFVVPHPPLLPAYSDIAPYNVIVVELEDDPAIRLVGNLVTSAEGEINEIDPRSIEIGEPVRVVFQAIDDEISMPRWIRAGD